jgi:S-adenosylmethionine hydrolase
MNLIVTLLSDWRLRDPYVSMFKGSLLSVFPEVQIIDMTHYVDKFNLPQTALLMKSGYGSFPEGSIHLILTNMSLNSTFSPVLLPHNGHYFIGEDNGVFHLMFGMETPLKGLQLSDNKENTLSQILKFIQLIKEGNLAQNTIEYPKFKRLFTEMPDHSASEKRIEGQIVYIDAFNNAVTNIPVSMFKKAVNGRAFTASIQSKGSWIIRKHFDHYTATDDEMYLCNNALGYLEIAAYQSDVAILADLEPGDTITIQYE